MSEPDRGAADLIRAVGLLADGPLRWGMPVPARRAGIYVVELAAPHATAPLEMTRVGKWLERLPALRVDGEHPTSKSLAARLAALWWPDTRVLYAGGTDRSIGGRVAALTSHVPGDRQPHPDGQWLHLLRDLERLGVRIWWAETTAAEEYLDALLEAFGAQRSTAQGRPAGAIPLPWANTRRPTGEHQATGITGSFLPAPARTPEPERHVVDLPPGDADGARKEERGTGTTRHGPTGPVSRPTTRVLAQPARPAPASRSRAATKPRPPAPAPVQLSSGALERLKVELDELTRVKRPEVVARIKSAREHGDLKENAEYHAAREEQSFLEGRVLALEDRLRRAVVVDEVATGKVILGSVVKVETGGDELEYTIVGSAESNISAGRLSSASPVGAALLGAIAGTEVEVRTPRGAVRYRVVSVD